MTQQITTNTAQQPINIDMNRLRKEVLLHIAIPCYGGMATESTMMSLIKWSGLAAQYGISWTFETMVNESLIPRARNTMVAKFLVDQPDATHLMFIDADIGFEPGHILMMLNRNVDLIGGLYSLKSYPVKWCLNSIENAYKTEDGLEEVSKVGTGFMMIKRGVFLRLNSHKDVIPYNNDTGLDKKYDSELRTYFETVVKNNRYYSEDWTFCENWRDLGGRVFVDKRVLLTHTGTIPYSNDVQEYMLKAFQPIIVDKLRAQGVQVTDAEGKPWSPV